MIKLNFLDLLLQLASHFYLVQQMQLLIQREFMYSKCDITIFLFQNNVEMLSLYC